MVTSPAQFNAHSIIPSSAPINTANMIASAVPFNADHNGVDNNVKQLQSVLVGSSETEASAGASNQLDSKAVLRQCDNQISSALNEISRGCEEDPKPHEALSVFATEFFKKSGIVFEGSDIEEIGTKATKVNLKKLFSKKNVFENLDGLKESLIKNLQQMYKNSPHRSNQAIIVLLESIGWNSHTGNFNSGKPSGDNKEFAADLLRVLSRGVRAQGDESKQSIPLLFSAYSFGQQAAELYDQCDQNKGRKKAEAYSHSVVGLRQLALKDVKEAFLSINASNANQGKDDIISVVLDATFKVLDIRLDIKTFDDKYDKASSEQLKWVASSLQALVEILDLKSEKLPLQIATHTVNVALRSRGKTVWGELDSYRRLGEALVQYGETQLGKDCLEVSLDMIVNDEKGGKNKTLAEIATFLAEAKKNGPSGDYDEKDVGILKLIAKEIQGKTAASDALSKALENGSVSQDLQSAYQGFLGRSPKETDDAKKQEACAKLLQQLLGESDLSVQGSGINNDELGDAKDFVKRVLNVDEKFDSGAYLIQQNCALRDVLESFLPAEYQDDLNVSRLIKGGLMCDVVVDGMPKSQSVDVNQLSERTYV